MLLSQKKNCEALHCTTLGVREPSTYLQASLLDEVLRVEVVTPQVQVAVVEHGSKSAVDQLSEDAGEVLGVLHEGLDGITTKIAIVLLCFQMMTLLPKWVVTAEVHGDMDSLAHILAIQISHKVRVVDRQFRLEQTLTKKWLYFYVPYWFFLVEDDP